MLGEDRRPNIAGYDIEPREREAHREAEEVGGRMEELRSRSLEHREIGPAERKRKRKRGRRTRAEKERAPRPD